MFSKPPGIEDIFPDRAEQWNFIINTAKDIFRKHNYRELIIPVFEYTEVFARGIGDDTDIVAKEMYTFEDRGGRSLTLRPEGTASAVRAYVENGKYNRLSICKFFYIGQMFRAERPQRGRLRQFNQFGSELFGSEDPYYDYEIITITDSIAKGVGIKDYTLLLNSIGCRECRNKYIEELKKYYAEKTDKLCIDCKKRLEKNTLRLLDCKNESCKALKENAPIITSHLDDECSEHYASVKKYLNDSGIDYKEDPYLVRGLDYYSRTTFELISGKLGSQNSFMGGGRYDQLVELFGGKPTPAVGFAAGIERIQLLIEGDEISSKGVDVYIIHSGGDALQMAIKLSSVLRENGFSVDIDPEVKGFKSQFKKADRENARYAVIIGEDEIAENVFSIKNLVSGEQEKVAMDNIAEYLSKSDTKASY